MTPSSRSPTPVPPSETSFEGLAADDALLKRSGTVISDVKKLERKVHELWIAEISAILPDVAEGEDVASPSGNGVWDTLRVC